MKLSPLFLILAASILVPTAARAQQKASSAEAQMKMIQSVIASKPSQPDVEVDMVPAEEASNCKMKDFQEGDYVGNEVDGPDGNPVRVLCRRKESSGAKNSQAEQIRFYNKGVEVFRDDYVTKESSWLGDAGSRRGIRGSAGIEKWVYISPEEATAEMVAALASGDEARYRRVALSADDIKSLGISDTLAEELTKRVDSLGEFKALADRLAIPEAVRWAAFNGNHQALLPKGRHGLKVDLPAYINATVVLVNPDDSSQSHQLYVGDMVRVGEVWKIIGLPTGEPFGQAGDSVSVASILFPSAEGESPTPRRTRAASGALSSPRHSVTWKPSRRPTPRRCARRSSTSICTGGRISKTSRRTSFARRPSSSRSRCKTAAIPRGSRSSRSFMTFWPSRISAAIWSRLSGFAS